jgi:DNA-directed RNA polymerase subunit M/transcription elongation factor TFIIS
MPRKKKSETKEPTQVSLDVKADITLEKNVESLDSEHQSLTKTMLDSKIDAVLKYDDLIPKHPFRESIYKKFYTLLIENKGEYNYTEDDLQKFALNIERGIFNDSLYGANSWDNKVKSKYTAIAVRIFSNLNPKSYLKNVNLIHRLFTKEFTEFELIKLDSEHIFPERYHEIMKEYIASQPKVSVKEEPTNDGMFKCGKCKTYKTSYYQMQTRSAKIIGWKSTLLITSWLCYWENSCSPSLNTQVLVN